MLSHVSVIKERLRNMTWIKSKGCTSISTLH